MMTATSLAILFLLGAAPAASAQCLVESYRQDGGATQGRLVTAGANRVAIASVAPGPSTPSVSVSELDGDGHSIATTADFVGSVCAIDLTLGNMQPSSVANLVVGFSQINAPFKGGTLVPNPDLVITGLPTLGGSLSVDGQLPYGLDGFSFYFQAWIVDSGASNNLAATNALRIDFGG